MSSRGASQSPEISVEFKREVETLLKTGKSLHGTVAFSSNGIHYLALVIAPDNDESRELVILAGGGPKPRIIYRLSEGGQLSLWGGNNGSSSNGIDITGDGAPELIVQLRDGNNPGVTVVLSVLGEKVEETARGLIVRIEDLDNDKRPELIVRDDRWDLYGGGVLSHADSPSALVVYTWDGRRYAYSSKRFPNFYDDAIRKQRKNVLEALSEADKTNEYDGHYIGAAIGLFLTRTHAGQREAALEELASFLSRNVWSDKQRLWREKILADFQTGKSSKLIAAPLAPLVGGTSPKSGQNTPAGEAELSRKAAIESIQSNYEGIEHKAQILRHLRKDLEGFTTEGGTLESFSEGGQVVKLLVKLFGETFRVIEEYYYANGQLILVISKVQKYNGDFGPVANSSVDRLYFHQRKLIQWLTDGFKPVNEEDQKFRENEKSTLENSDKYLLWAKDKRGAIPPGN
jgi:hypothetical protein